MKLHLTLILGLSLLLGSERAGAQSSLLSEGFAGFNARLCVERPENDGVVNLAEVHVVFGSQTISGGNLTVIMRGGSAVCVFTEPGRFTLVAHSSDVYPRSGRKPKVWRSNTLRGTVVPGETVIIGVNPGRSGTTYDKTWVLKELRRVAAAHAS
jgi:hypothetical protein